MDASCVQGHQKANKKRCVRKQIQANASQEGSVATHLAPKGLLPYPAALRGRAKRRRSQKEAGTPTGRCLGARKLRGKKDGEFKTEKFLPSGRGYSVKK